ncbi:MAG: hypothetical protein L3J17_00360 [Candidatus Jettenia sp.]|nr:MAG: hypothetical protein L3J17_00360 [Candidatus Jettenia sp.]
MAMKNIPYKVPKNNKEIFIDPSIDSIPNSVLTNTHKIHTYKIKMAGIPLRELRDKTREELLYKAAGYTSMITSLFHKNQARTFSSVQHNNKRDASWLEVQDKLHVKGQVLDYESIKNIPIIQTGHEPIFYYPGVWIKNHLAYHVAEKVGGISVNMIVDNDACNMGFMHIPVLSNTSASIQKVLFVRDKYKTAYEEIRFDDFGTILRFREEVLSLFKKNASDKNNNAKITVEHMRSMFERFINCMVESYQQGCTDMVGLLTSARCALEKDFFIHNLEIPASSMCSTDGFYYFLLHILYEAGRFSKIYNEKLSEYRRIHKIRSHANPLPDLKISGNLIELPFWIWNTGGQRGKCYVLDEGECIKVTQGGDVLITLRRTGEVDKSLSRLRALLHTDIKIRPRAITTTMFSRLFFSDVFIHGIGGAKYDTITDEIIKEFFGIDPPTFITVSATLFLPFDTFDSDIGTAQRLQNDLRNMTYNPELYTSKDIQNDTGFMDKAREKQTLLKMADCTADEKRQRFNKIKELNKLMLNQIRAEFHKKQQELSTVSENLAYNEVVRFREYPIYIYPMEVLQQYFLPAFSEG